MGAAVSAHHLPRLAREVEARHELRHAHDEVLREIREAESIDPDLGEIKLTAAEVAAMTVEDAVESAMARLLATPLPAEALDFTTPRRYRRRTHAEVQTEGYAQGYAAGYNDRDKTATQQSLAWMQQREHVEFRVRVAFITGYVGGLVCMAVLWLLL